MVTFLLSSKNGELEFRNRIGERERESELKFRNRIKERGRKQLFTVSTQKIRKTSCHLLPLFIT